MKKINRFEDIESWKSARTLTGEHLHNYFDRCISSGTLGWKDSNGGLTNLLILLSHFCF